MLGVLACRPAIGVQALRPCKMLCTRCNSHHNAASQPVTGMRHSGQAGASVASRAAAQGAQKAACKHGCNRQDLSASMHTTQSASSPGAHTALAQGSSGAGGDSGGARGVRLACSGLAALTASVGRAATSAGSPSSAGGRS